MGDFRVRLEIEQAYLLSKIEKLDEFLTNGDTKDVSGDQLTLLKIQLKAMDTYNTCLVERLNRL